MRRWNPGGIYSLADRMSDGEEASAVPPNAGYQSAYWEGQNGTNLQDVPITTGRRRCVTWLTHPRRTRAGGGQRRYCHFCHRC